MFSDLYDKKYLVKCLLWFGIVFGLMRITGGAGFAIVIPMILYSMLVGKEESLLFWLIVSVCSIIANSHLVIKGGGFAWIQRGVMLSLGGCMAFYVLAHPLHRVMRPYAGMFFYIVFMAFSSLFGWNPIISYLKLILFTLIYCSYMGVANQVGVSMRVSSRKIRSLMLAVAVLFVVGSMMLVPFPGLSQVKAEDFQLGNVDLSNFTSLFTGMANHSQCLGPVVSSIAVILWGDLLFSIKRADLLYILLLLCCPYLIYLTSSRTGMGAYVLGMVFVGYLFFVKSRGVGSRWKSRVFSFLMCILVLLTFAVLSLPGVQTRVTNFVLKTRASEKNNINAEVIMSSRQALIDNAMYNFKKSPFIGNGFQVSAGMERLKIKDFKQLLSAPIEKGVWVSAVLEESGIIGWLIFVLLLCVCIINSIAKRAYIGASCLFLCTLTNLGEFTFFSMSYTGGFTWAMVFVGLALDMRRLRDEEMMLYYNLMARGNENRHCNILPLS